MTRRFAHLMVAVFLLSTALLHADSPRFDPATMMRADAVERGMTGYGLSVFEGVTIERFDVKVLGVLTKAIAGEDLILAEITSGPVIERESGVIGGMSGSPIYIKGRLVGALAYGWGFSREPICGITPIEAMLDSHPADGAAQVLLAPDHPARGAMVDGRWVTRANVQPISETVARFAGPDTINLQPVAPLIYASGLKSESMQVLADAFDPYGIEPMAGPGRMSNPVPVELAPGSAIGVGLATGSFDITGIGTVTWRDGDDILAFGHPMMTLGDVDFPMTTAWILDFIPSISRSNKLGSGMETVGSIVRDGNWAIGGTVGRQAATIPATVIVTDEDRGLTREFTFEVARQKLLTGNLLMSLVAGSMEAVFSPGGPGVGTIDFTLQGDQGAEITRRDVVWHPGMVMGVTSWLGESMQVLVYNRYQPQNVAGLEVRVGLTGVDRSAAVERIYTEENVARAGKPLHVHVVLRPEGGEPIEKVVVLQMPDNLPKGRIRVGAGAGADEWSLKSRLRLMMPQINSLQDIAEVIRTMRRADQLFVAAALPEITLAVQGTELPHLPTSVAESLITAARTDMDAGYTELSETFATDLVLYGYQTIRIPTEDRQGNRGKVTGASPGDESEDGMASGAVGDTGLEKLWWAAPSMERMSTPADDLPPEVKKALDELEDELGADGDLDLGLDDEDDEDDADADHPEPNGDALSRQLSDWTQDDADDFEAGDADGVLVRSDGTLMLAPAPTVLAQTEEPYIWSVAPAGDSVYFGTANPGRVYRWTEAEGAKLVYDTGQFMVLCLLPLESGDVLAGTGPGGKVFRIAADGAGELAWELPVSYVWALAARADGSTVAGTGPGGRIYTLGDDPTVLSTITQPHVLSLVEAGGTLYAAGGPDEGGLFRISAEGAARDLLGTDEESCTGVAADDEGRLYVTTASDGKILCVHADGSVTELVESDESVLGVCFKEGMAWAATADAGKVLVTDARGRSGVAYTDPVAASVLAVAAGDDAVFAVTANPARLIRLGLRGEITGSYDSPVLDAERVSRWARISWDASVPEGASLAITTRSGNSQVPEDGSWGSWTEPCLQGSDVTCPAARYLQYRVTFSRTTGAGPRLKRLTVLYMPGNQRPTIEIDEPEAGEAVRSDLDISWSTDDDDDDTLQTTVYARRHGDDEWDELAVVQDEESWAWDTTEVEDGLWSLKLVCTDRPGNAIDPLDDEAIVDTVVVDNAHPELMVFDAPVRDGEAPVVLRGLAQDELSRITSVDWRAATDDDDGDWLSAAPDDGLLSSTRELFTISAEGLDAEVTALEVRLRDAAGNVTVETVTITGGEAVVDEEAQG